MDTKKCSTCKKEKPLSNFAKRTLKTKVIKQSQCKQCNSERCKREYDEGPRKALKIEYTRAHRKRLRDMVSKHKLKHGCHICQYNKNPSALDLHHIKDKLHDISRMVQDCVNIDKLKTEISKCIVLCANCHRELHNSS